MHQGWPKFAAHLWMRTPDEGICAVAYAPSRASFKARGVPVTVSLDTDYPFRERLRHHCGGRARRSPSRSCSACRPGRTGRRSVSAIFPSSA